MKIYIIGYVGSGKTTLARRLSVSLSIPHFETDNFVWQRQKEGDVRNPESVRDAQFSQALEQSSWIIEGVHLGWTDYAMDMADKVIFLDIPYHTRTFRVIFRYINQRVGKEQANYQPSFVMLRKMFQWNRYFEDRMKPELLTKLGAASEKVVVVNNRKQLDDLLIEFAK
ncbi:AAA family ATPase [Planococcus halocryophilus]|uniref:AAA family ATPase n=1 Tax=Planococcus halocryophilus TaxID=1215089 RepID=UPI001F0E8D57|nr:DNA topology modulation protein FlaR [Planococcus halocryophilus]MCH4827928.1 DNA topology modulation protein FlaR [Planococcus halocryophilus]